MKLHGLTSSHIVLSVKEKSDPHTPGMKGRIYNFCTGVLYEKLL